MRTSHESDTMRISRRLPAAAGLGLLLAASGLLSAGATPASALVPASITGAAPATAVSPGQVSFSYTITLPTAVDATSLSTTQDPALAASATGVTLDGNPVPAGQIQQSGADISVQTGAQPTDGLAAGSHTIAFTAAVGTTAAVTASSTATLNYTLAGSPASITSVPVTVALNQPDLSVILTPDSGEDQVGLLGTGRGLDMLVDVLNLGPNTPTADFQIDLPVGLKLGPDGVTRDSGGRPLSCLADPGNPQQLHCPLGAIQPNGSVDPTLDIELTTATGAPAGQVVPITVSVQPELGQGTDTDPSNNSATAHIQLTGSARLSYTISPATTKVALGAKTAVRLTIHNAGPQPAPQTIAFTILVGGTFNVVSFTGQTAPPPGVGSAELPAIGVSPSAERCGTALVRR